MQSAILMHLCVHVVLVVIATVLCAVMINADYYAALKSELRVGDTDGHAL